MKREKMLRKLVDKKLSMALCLFFSALALPAHAREAVVFREDFEGGIDNWGADNGVWQVGTPTGGPRPSCYQGRQCAGTVLNGNYPGNTDSHFISPSINLPRVTGNGEILLFFWHWFSYFTWDAGYVQISTFDRTTLTWSDWTTISEPIDGISEEWTRFGLDLTAYAGAKWCIR